MRNTVYEIFIKNKIKIHFSGKTKTQLHVDELQEAHVKQKKQQRSVDATATEDAIRVATISFDFDQSAEYFLD